MTDPMDGGGRFNAATLFSELQSPEIEKFWPAFVAFQSNLENIGATREGQTGNQIYPYVPLDAIMAAIREPLAKAKLCLTHQVVPDADEQSWLVSRLVHESGQWIGSAVPVGVTADGGGIKSFGSQLSYIARYNVRSLCGLGLTNELEAEDPEAGDVPGPPERKRAADVAPQQPRPSKAEAPPTPQPGQGERSQTAWTDAKRTLLETRAATRAVALGMDSAEGGELLTAVVRNFGVGKLEQISPDQFGAIAAAIAVFGDEAAPADEPELPIAPSDG